MKQTDETNENKRKQTYKQINKQTNKQTNKTIESNQNTHNLEAVGSQFSGSPSHPRRSGSQRSISRCRQEVISALSLLPCYPRAPCSTIFLALPISKPHRHRSNTSQEKAVSEFYVHTNWRNFARGHGQVVMAWWFVCATTLPNPESARRLTQEIGMEERTAGPRTNTYTKRKPGVLLNMFEEAEKTPEAHNYP